MGLLLCVYCIGFLLMSVFFYQMLRSTGDCRIAGNVAFLVLSSLLWPLVLGWLLIGLFGGSSEDAELAGAAVCLLIIIGVVSYVVYGVVCM